MYSHALRRLALVTGLIGLVSPVASAAGSAAPNVSRPVVHHMTAGPAASTEQLHRSAAQRLAAAMAAAPNVTAAEHVWMRHEARAALTQFAAAATPLAGSTISGPFDLLTVPLVAAGDLAGNGRQDVLQVRLRPTRDFVTASLTARDSKTGRALWTRVGPKADEVLPLAVGRFGTPSQRGVLVEQFATQTLSKNSFRSSETIAAWSGRTGKTVWTTKPVTGTETETPTTVSATDLPELASAFRATAGRRLDVLIPIDTFVFSLTGVGPPPPNGGSAKAVLVAGKDGTSSSPYPPLSSSTALPSLQPVDDLNGDGLDDVLAIAPGKPGSMTAERGDTGATIWSVSRNIAAAGLATAVGRLSGGRIGDFAVQGNNVSLVRGRDGKVLWTRRSFDEGVPLGRVRAGHHVALALVGAIDSGSTSSSGLSKEASIVDIRAITATNRVVWHTRIAAVLRSKHLNGNGSDSTDLNIVDVQPDGTADFAVRVAVHRGHKHAKKSGLVNGRSGKFQPGRFGAPAAGSLVHGEGTDLLRANPAKHGILLSGYDGETGQLLMSRLVGMPGHLRGAFARGLRATGHRCSDIETGAINRRRHVVLDLVSGAGARLWSVRYSLKRLTGGHLVRYKAPQHFCAASR
jgi:hypothetical protein